MDMLAVIRLGLRDRGYRTRTRPHFQNSVAIPHVGTVYLYEATLTFMRKHPLSDSETALSFDLTDPGSLDQFFDAVSASKS